MYCLLIYNLVWPGMSCKRVHNSDFYQKGEGTRMMEMKEEGHYNRIFPFPLFSPLFDD